MLSLFAIPFVRTALLEFDLPRSNCWNMKQDMAGTRAFIINYKCSFLPSPMFVRFYQAAWCVKHDPRHFTVIHHCHHYPWKSATINQNQSLKQSTYAQVPQVWGKSNLKLKQCSLRSSEIESIIEHGMIIYPQDSALIGHTRESQTVIIRNNSKVG